MSNKNSNLNLVKPQQAQKEVVINSLFNAMSSAAFGGKNEIASSGLRWGLYGGSDGKTIIPNTVLNLTDNTTNYISFNKTTAQFEVNTTKFGDYALYKVTTSGQNAIDWEDYRTNIGGGGGGATDPNFVSNGSPSTLPTATEQDSVAIGSRASASGIRSLALTGGSAGGQDSMAWGSSSFVASTTRYSISLGSSNRIENGDYSGIFAGGSNTIRGNTGRCSIIGSYACSISSSSYNYNTIYNCNASNINGGSQNCIINSYTGLIDTNVAECTVFGMYAKSINSFTYQFSFCEKVKQQFAGFSVDTNSSVETELSLGNGFSNIKKYKIENNQVINFKFTLIGVSSNFDVHKMSCEVLVKKYNNVVTFAGEATATKDFKTDVSDAVLQTATAKVVAKNNTEINILVKSVDGLDVTWSCVADQVIVQRARI